MAAAATPDQKYTFQMRVALPPKTTALEPDNTTDQTMLRFINTACADIPFNLVNLKRHVNIKVIIDLEGKKARIRSVPISDAAAHHHLMNTHPKIIELEQIPEAEREKVVDDVSRTVVERIAKVAIAAIEWEWWTGEEFPLFVVEVEKKEPTKATAAATPEKG